MDVRVGIRRRTAYFMSDFQAMTMPLSRENDLRIFVMGAFVLAALGLLVVSDRAGNRDTQRAGTRHQAPEFLATDFYDR